MNDFSNAIRRLEQDNYTLLKIKEDLEKCYQDKSNETRNLNFDFKYQKEESLKREGNLNENVNRLEAEILREKETYRNLL